ncbi:F-box protein SKIP23-like [Elaeis guineensis]|uniref:F-box protein SKIP23-like n=1 Tax=Elaeis guineensis var. tenera TaxID=51953 RepID=A0A6I9RTC4_ELAGV|nr:F-box protein SKIP23-like [Elaeis guineensis]
MRAEVDRYTRLPPEILELILRRLALTDCLRFASVCTSWRLALSECRLLPPRHPPWLMYGGAPAGSRRSLACYSLFEGRHIELQLPAGYESSHIAGTSAGWLIMSSDAERRITLLNPVSKVQIELPSNLHPSHHPGFKFFEDTPVGAKRNICTHWKAALSSVPTASNCIVAVKGTDGVLIWCRVGDSEWRVFDDGLRVYSDVIFHRGRLYAAGVRGEVVVVGFDEA